MDFLTSIPKDSLNIYIIIALLILIIILVIWLVMTEIRIKRLMRGKGGNSLEDSFNGMRKDINDFMKFRNELEKYLESVEKRVSRSIQGVHNINFNAFTGMESGGKSFALAILNEKGDGVIVSSLNARDRVSVFSKKINNFKSDIDLSEEEVAALTKAKESCSL